MKLEQYLSNDLDRNVIDHSVRAAKNEKGEASIYAHPSGANGDTVDYFVVGNSLIEKNPVNIGKLELCQFDFGAAVSLLKAGKKVARAGWNGNGMYAFLIGVPGSSDYWTYTNGKNDNFPLLPFVAMNTADDKVVPWLASQTGILAEDWMVVE